MPDSNVPGFFVTKFMERKQPDIAQRILVAATSTLIAEESLGVAAHALLTITI